MHVKCARLRRSASLSRLFCAAWPTAHGCEWSRCGCFRREPRWRGDGAQMRRSEMRPVGWHDRESHDATLMFRKSALEKRVARWAAAAGRRQGRRLQCAPKDSVEKCQPNPCWYRPAVEELLRQRPWKRFHLNWNAGGGLGNALDSAGQRPREWQAARTCC